MGKLDGKVALISGGARGQGAVEAAVFAREGAKVVFGDVRDDEGRKVEAAIRAEGGHAVYLHLDVASEADWQRAVHTAVERYGRLDVLVNNAGVVGSRAEVLETGPAELLACYATNVFGPVRVTRAFVPLLRRSANPRVVMVSSGLGSFAVTTDPSRIESRIVALGYPSSKSALNMITTQYAKALPEFRVNVVDPGYTATDLNGHSGPQTVEQGTDAIVELATIGPDGPTGGYFDRTGPLAW